MGYEETQEFELLETMRWSAEDGYFLLDRHLERMRGSAAVFGFGWPAEAIARGLRQAADGFDGKAQRVRLLLHRDGRVELQAQPLDASIPVPLRVGLAPWAVASGDAFLYHKTTRREVYDRARELRPDCDDVLLYNERNELTESCMANVVVMRDGQGVTPPVSCGLLNGTYRAFLIERGEIREGVVRLDELPRAERLFLINSVRQWMPAVLLP